MDKPDLKERIEVILKNSEEANIEGHEISLRQIIQALINGRKIIAIAVIVALLFGLVGTYLTANYKGVAKIMISLNFDGIEKGLDPFGEKFDLGKIKAPIITSRVVQNLGLGKYNVTAEDIRKNIAIQPVVPGDVVNKIANLKASVEKGKENVKTLEDYVYYPTDYIITFSIPKDMKISKAVGQEILDSLVNTYSDYFYETYGEKTVLANAIGKMDYKDYDYPEISVIMNNQIDTMTSYLDTKAKQAKDFRSNKTGLTFSDIIASIQVIDQVEINKMNSLIVSNMLTKNKAALINYYDYTIKRLELSKAKKTEEARVSSDLMSKFQKDQNILLMPGTGVDGESTLKSEAPNPMYDSLTQSTLSASVNAGNIEQDIQFYRNQLALYQAPDTIPTDQKAAAEKSVNALITGIQTKLNNWISLANETVAEYYETEYYNNAVMKLSPAEMTSATDKEPLILGIALLLGLVVGSFLALFMEYWKNSAPATIKKSETV